MRYKFINDRTLNVAKNGNNFFFTGRLHEFLKANFMGDKLIDLSGGTGGRTGERVYTAPNGVVVTSDYPTWNNSNYYYMEYMFNNVISSSLSTGGTEAVKYHLMEDPPNGLNFANITLDFTNYADYKGIRRLSLFPTTRSDSYVKYSVEVSKDNISWEQVTDEINGRNITVGTPVEHIIDVDSTYKFIRIRLVKLSTYLAFDEIRVYEPDPTATIDLSKNYIFANNNDSNLSLRNNEIKDISIDGTIPLGSGIKSLLTFDGGLSFFRYDGGSHQTMVNDITGTIIVGGSYSTAYDETKVNTETNGVYGEGYWRSNNTLTQKWIGYQFSEPRMISEINWTQGTFYDTASVVVEKSDDGVNWVAVTDTITIIADKSSVIIKVPPTKKAMYWRIRGLTFHNTYMSAYTLTMKEYSNFHFSLVDPSEIETYGMTLQELNDIPSVAYENILNAKLNFYFSFKVDSPDIKPSINNLTVDVVIPSEKADSIGGGIHESNMDFLEAPSIVPIDIDGVNSKLVASEGKLSEGLFGESKPLINFLMVPSTMASVDAPITRLTKEFLGIQYGIGIEKTPPFQPRLFPKLHNPAIYNGQIINEQPLDEDITLAVPNGVDGKPLNPNEVSKYWKSPDRRRQ